MEWREVPARLLADPEVSRHYDELTPAYRSVAEALETRKRLDVGDDAKLVDPETKGGAGDDMSSSHE